MEANGQMPVPTKRGRKGEKDREPGTVQRAPCEKPPFTLGEIKKAIPPHCFKRSLLKSFSYLLYDLTMVSIFYYIANTYFHELPAPWRYGAWPVYWAIQGCYFMAIWVIAHECGHHAFSEYHWLNDCVGLVLHSALLSPYFSWKYSHRRHHSNAASLERDENFVPKPLSKMSWYAEYQNTPLGCLLTLIITLTLGWPLYLLFNVSSRPYDRLASHFDPYSPIFSDKERLQIYITDAGIMATTYGLYKIMAINGLAWLVCVYGVPILIMNAFLVMITYLHHTHPSLPHYDSSEWDWLRGSLSTVDRDYGVLSKVFHNIADTHVAHHLFSTIPHYHAMEATKAIKPILGDYYQFDGTPVYKAIYRDARACFYIEPDNVFTNKGVFWYKN